jgi:hypothetical protein
MSELVLKVDEFVVVEQTFSRRPWPSQNGYAVRFAVQTEETVKEFKNRMKEIMEDDAATLTLQEPSGRKVTIDRFFVSGVKGVIGEDHESGDEGEEKEKRILGELWGKSVNVQEPLSPRGLGMGW